MATTTSTEITTNLAEARRGTTVEKESGTSEQGDRIEPSVATAETDLETVDAATKAGIDTTTSLDPRPKATKSLGKDTLKIECDTEPRPLRSILLRRPLLVPLRTPIPEILLPFDLLLRCLTQISVQRYRSCRPTEPLHTQSSIWPCLPLFRSPIWIEEPLETICTSSLLSSALSVTVAFLLWVHRVLWVRSRSKTLKLLKSPSQSSMAH